MTSEEVLKEAAELLQFRHDCPPTATGQLQLMALLVRELARRGTRDEMIDDLKERVAKLERLFEQTDTSQSDREIHREYERRAIWSAP